MDKEKWPYKTGDLLEEVQKIKHEKFSMAGQENCNLIIQVNA